MLRARLVLALCALALAGALRSPLPGKPSSAAARKRLARDGTARGGRELSEPAPFAPAAWLEERAASVRASVLATPLGEKAAEALAEFAKTPVGEAATAVVSFLREPVAVPGWIAASTAAAGSAVLGVVVLVSLHIGSPTEIEKQALLFGDVLRQVEDGYVQPVDTTALFERGTNAMLHSLDPFTEFENSAARADLDLFTAGAYGGVGLGIGPDPYQKGAILVRDAREGYAFDAGLRVGDHLLEIGGQPVAELSLDAAMGLLRGLPGTDVSVVFTRDGDPAGAPPRVATLSRKQVLVPAVSLAALAPLAPGSSCGYVKLGAFSSSAPAELRAALAQLGEVAAREGNSMDALVLDLRGNSGGLLNAALQVNEALLPHGAPLVTTQGREPASRVTFVSGGAPVLPPSVRLAVLVDGRTASASEIVAGAVQDLDRGVVVGGRSYGKGLVQSVLPLPFGNELKVTVAKYYTPSGRCIQRLAYAGTDGALSPSAVLAARSSPAGPAERAPPVQKLPSALRPSRLPATPAAPAVPGSTPGAAPGSATAAPSPAPAPAAEALKGPQPAEVWLSDGGHLIRDSERKSFLTLHGRTVRDGGGIEADVVLPSARPGPVERQLAEADVFFAFARQLALDGRLPAPPAGGGPAQPFTVDTRTLDEFDAFAQKRLAELGAPLQSPLEQRLEQLTAALQEEEALGGPELSAQLPALGQLRAQAHAQLQSALRGAERRAIERRIARAVDARTAPDSTLLSRALRGDNDLQAAIGAVKTVDGYLAAFKFDAAALAAAGTSTNALSGGSGDAAVARGGPGTTVPAAAAGEDALAYEPAADAEAGDGERAARLGLPGARRLWLC